MSDRELLVLAAKAVGMKTGPESPWFEYSDLHGFRELNQDGSAVVFQWNPRNDDADAFRLESALGLSFSWSLWSVSSGHGSVFQSFELFKDHGEDRNKARRMASLRAAAKLGRSLP